MTSFSSRLTALGLDVGRLPFALRTAVGTCLALLVAWLIGLEHPQWAAMTVWATALPGRDQLLEKAAYRVTGTVVGALVGVLLVVVTGGDPLWMVLGLVPWVALCVGTGNVVRGFVSYGILLAGYSAALVALLHVGPPGNILHLGVDRVLTVLVGAVTGVCVGWLFGGTGVESRHAERVRWLAVRTLQDLAEAVSTGRAMPSGPRRERLLDLARVEDGLDVQGTGTLRWRRTVSDARRQLAAQVAALLWMRTWASERQPCLAAHIEQAAAALEAGDDDAAVERALRRAWHEAAHMPGLQEVLAELAAAMPGYAPAPGARQPALVLHRDWAGALLAGARAALMLGLAGAVWLVSGWAAGPYLMLGVSVMLSVFSTFENPARVMPLVVLGSVLAVMASLVRQWVFWPGAGSELGMLLMTMPFVLVGAFLLVHRRIGPAGMDYNMNLLLLTHLVYPHTEAFGHSVEVGLAVIAGPAAALIAYRYLFPMHAQRRRQMLVDSMLGELRTLAQRPWHGLRQRVWRHRLAHRILRLVHWTEKTGGDLAGTIEGSAAVLILGRAVSALHAELGAGPLPAGVRRRYVFALACMRRVASRPAQAARALERAARCMAQPSDASSATQLREAAAALRQNVGFLSDAQRRSDPLIAQGPQPA